MKKFEAGFIGAGNMGGALATAAAKQVTGELVAVACSSPAHSAAAAERLGCRAAAPEEILGGSKFVFLGVKPQMIDGVVQSLAAPIAASESIFVSMLAGVQLERLERLLGADKKIIRILPNTACAVGQGVVLYCANGNVTEGDLAAFCALMAAAGIVDPISEALIDAGCAITGCGPAFAYMFIEALADGGVSPEQVGYINAHGTSTHLNDAGETAAVKTVFGPHAYQLAMSSTKSMTGHMLGAAGAVEAIFTALSLRDGFLPATIHYQTPDPDCDLDVVPNEGRPADIRYALSNSLGFGGHNGSLLLRKWED